MNDIAIFTGKLNTLFNKLIKLPTWKYFFGFFFVFLIIGLLTFFFPDEAGNVDNGYDFNSTFKVILFGVILISCLETLVFQTLIISIVRLIIKKDKFNFYPAIILSAITFSINHNYNYYYMIYGFIGGVVLALAYYITKYRKENATLLVFSIHALYNLVAYGLEAV